MATFSSPILSWSLDVSSLMVLIGDSEELKYRLAGRSLLETLIAAPVAGVQNYLRSYEFLDDPGSLTYFSPYGCKSAPLRNSKLRNAISRACLIEDGRFTVLRIPEKSRAAPNGTSVRSPTILLWLWFAFTWLYFAGLVAFCMLMKTTTWIGIVNCTVFLGWSIITRVIERVKIKPAPLTEAMVARSGEADAIFILGRNNSAFVMEGSRIDIKNWTSRGLTYHEGHHISPAFWQYFTRAGTLLVLLLIFTTIPNGSTMDQLAFVLLNGLGQINVLVGLRLNAQHCLAQLEKLPDVKMDNRTQVFAMLLRKFGDLEDSSWCDKANLLPQTPIWQEWRKRILKDIQANPKALYNEISNELGGSLRLVSQESTLSMVNPTGESENDKVREDGNRVTCWNDACSQSFGTSKIL